MSGVQLQAGPDASPLPPSIGHSGHWLWRPLPAHHQGPPQASGSFALQFGSPQASVIFEAARYRGKPESIVLSVPWVSPAARQSGQLEHWSMPLQRSGLPYSRCQRRRQRPSVEEQPRQHPCPPLLFAGPDHRMTAELQACPPAGSAAHQSPKQASRSAAGLPRRLCNATAAPLPVASTAPSHTLSRAACGPSWRHALSPLPARLRASCLRSPPPVPQTVNM